MPYKWSAKTSDSVKTLSLWQHQSLPARGMAAFVLATFTLITIPLFGLLGTKLLWGLLPFLMIAVGGIWYALHRSYQDRSTLEILTITPNLTTLKRHNPRTPNQNWECNSYWVKVMLHPNTGPVPNYVTLSGNAREVEVGAFLSEEERKLLYQELTDEFAVLQKHK